MTAATLFGALLIRADASPAAGIGHLMRGLALAQAWQDRGGNARFVTSDPPPALVARLEREGFPVAMLGGATGEAADAAATLEIARAGSDRWLVVDGYGFGAGYLAAIRKAGLSLLVVDDQADKPLDAADLVLNQNLHAKAGDYPGIARERLMLGNRHVLLRREFTRARSAAPAAQAEALHLVLTMGGSDPGNVTERLLRWLRDWKGPVIRLSVLSGPANPHRDSIRAAIGRLDGILRASLVEDPGDLPALFASADLAITAAGTSCWELACLGVPMLLIVVADNQRAGANALAVQGVAVLAGWHESLAPMRLLGQLHELVSSPERRHRLAAAGRALIDGQGAGRVAERLATHPVALRDAATSDAKILFDWANDPLTRRMSFHPEQIPWTDHVAWLDRRLKDPHCRFQIASEIGAGDIGQVRLDRAGGVATLNVGLAPAARGRGLAARLIRRAAVESLDTGWCARVDAWVRRENEASLACFRRAGFRELGSRADRPTGAAPADAVLFSFP